MDDFAERRGIGVGSTAWAGTSVTHAARQRPSTCQAASLEVPLGWRVPHELSGSVSATAEHLFAGAPRLHTETLH